MEINKLIQEKNQIIERLEKLNYGSVEIREKDSKKYIYTHFRNDGIVTSKYVGEYSNELYNLVLENNELAKELKKRLKAINKELKDINYVEQGELDPSGESSNKQEQHYYAILRRIKDKYSKYLEGFDNSEDLTDEEKTTNINNPHQTTKPFNHI